MSSQTALPVALASWHARGRGHASEGVRTAPNVSASDAVSFARWLERVKALHTADAVRVLVADDGSHAVALPAGAELDPARDGFYRLPAGAA